MSFGQAHANTIGGFAELNGGTTGGAGGQVIRVSSGVGIHQALCTRASSDTPIIIEVEGTVNHGNTAKVSGDSCNTADDKIELKDISNVTIVGVGSGALFDELGIHIRNSSNIIIRNVHVRNVKKSGSPTSNGGDAIGMESNVSNVWVDHATLEASGGESGGYDALFDVKNNSKYITLSYSILRNSGRGGLVGSSDSDDNNGPITFHHNFYENIDSRTPLLRHGTAHSYNNYFDGIYKSGMNPRIGGEMKAQNNVFENAKDPLGTFYTDKLGYWDISGNIFASSVTWSGEDDDYYPAGPNPISTTSISIPYAYSLDNANCVKSIVLATAGANKGLAASDGSCSVTTPPDGGDTGGGDTGGGDTGGGDTGGGDTGGGDTGGGDTGGGDTPTNLGQNLSIGGGADGSSKASGTSYGNVIDGDLSSYWSPSSSTGRISVKRLDTTINAVRIIEASGAQGNVTSWTLKNHDTGEVLTSGNAIPDVITFSPVNLYKVSFEVNSSNGTPRIAEFEVYNAN
ncbi:pectate lyase family protein [Alteromonas sp. a30]|uniref:pectate lyase family protein n=1 Tax=Alteromonas sp. a30 TaxID=2730917 RepID=UPI00227FA7BC|nr:pectate lyase [Alteromonas sp. a30]